jgi:hypothetical protein
MPSEPDNVVLEHLRAIRSDITVLKADVAVIKADIAAIKTEQHTHAGFLDVLQQDVRLIRAAVNDMARTDVTAGEIEALHHDVNRFQRQLLELTTRVEALETERQ